MTKNDIQGKLTNRGTPCIFMGYSINHAHDVYRMLIMDTKKFINSQDIVWISSQVYTFVGRRKQWWAHSCSVQGVLIEAKYKTLFFMSILTSKKE
jgi:hypothetical protein